MPILELEDQKTHLISLKTVWKNDLKWWLLSGLTIVGINLLIALIAKQVDSQEATLLYLSYYVIFLQPIIGIGLTVAGAIVAIRKSKVKIIIASLTGLFYWQLMVAGSILNSTFPVPMVGAMCGIVAVASIARIAEYLHMIYVVQLDNAPKFTPVVWAIYLAAAIVATALVMF